MSSKLPLAIMDKCIGQNIWIIMKSKREFAGILRGFDDFFNLVLENVTEIWEEEGEKKKRQCESILLNGHDITYVNEIQYRRWYLVRILLPKNNLNHDLLIQNVLYNNKSFMNKAQAIGIVSLTLLALFVSFHDHQTTTQNIQTEEPRYPWLSEDCTQALAVQCAADIELTIKNCAKAYETEGADIIADIKCAKDLMADKKHCWPCICAEAKKKGWKVIGC